VLRGWGELLLTFLRKITYDPYRTPLHQNQGKFGVPPDGGAPERKKTTHHRRVHFLLLFAEPKAAYVQGASRLDPELPSLPQVLVESGIINYPAQETRKQCLESLYPLLTLAVFELAADLI
jgi:hypothetical protein